MYLDGARHRALERNLERKLIRKLTDAKEKNKSPNVLIFERNILFPTTDKPASDQKDFELFMTVNALYNGSAAV